VCPIITLHLNIHTQRPLLTGRGSAPVARGLCVADASCFKDVREHAPMQTDLVTFQHVLTGQSAGRQALSVLRYRVLDLGG
jgi:hypothetical protein